VLPSPSRAYPRRLLLRLGRRLLAAVGGRRGRRRGGGGRALQRLGLFGVLQGALGVLRGRGDGGRVGAAPIARRSRPPAHSIAQPRDHHHRPPSPPPALTALAFFAGSTGSPAAGGAAAGAGGASTIACGGGGQGGVSRPPAARGLGAPRFAGRRSPRRRLMRHASRGRAPVSASPVGLRSHPPPPASPRCGRGARRSARAWSAGGWRVATARADRDGRESTVAVRLRAAGASACPLAPIPARPAAAPALPPPPARPADPTWRPRCRRSLRPCKRWERSGERGGGATVSSARPPTEAPPAPSPPQAVAGKETEFESLVVRLHEIEVRGVVEGGSEGARRRARAPARGPPPSPVRRPSSLASLN